MSRQQSNGLADEMLIDERIMAAYYELRERGFKVTYEDATAALENAANAKVEPR